MKKKLLILITTTFLILISITITHAQPYKSTKDTLAVPTIFKLPGQPDDQFAYEPFIVGHTGSLFELQQSQNLTDGNELYRTYREKLADEGKIDPTQPDIFEIIQWDFVRAGYFSFIIEGQSFAIRFFNPAEPESLPQRDIIFTGVLKDNLSYEVINLFDRVPFIDSVRSKPVDELTENFSYLLDTGKFGFIENISTAAEAFRTLQSAYPGRAIELFQKLDEGQKSLLLGSLSPETIGRIVAALEGEMQNDTLIMIKSVVTGEEFATVKSVAKAVRALSEAEEKGLITNVTGQITNIDPEEIIHLDTAEDFVINKLLQEDLRQRKGHLLDNFMLSQVNIPAALAARLFHSKDLSPELGRTQVYRLNASDLPANPAEFINTFKTILENLQAAGSTVLLVDFDGIFAMYMDDKETLRGQILPAIIEIAAESNTPFFGFSFSSLYPRLKEVEGFSELLDAQLSSVPAREFGKLLRLSVSQLSVAYQLSFPEETVALALQYVFSEAIYITELIDALVAIAEKAGTEGVNTIEIETIKTAFENLKPVTKTRFGDPDLTEAERRQLETKLQDTPHFVVGAENQPAELVDTLQEIITNIRTGPEKYRALADLISDRTLIRVVTGNLGKSYSFEVTDKEGLIKPVYAYTSGNIIYITEAFVRAALELSPEALTQLTVHEAVELNGGTHQDAEAAELAFGSLQGRISILDAFIEALEAQNNPAVDAPRVTQAINRRADFGIATLEGEDILTIASVDIGDFSKSYFGTKGLQRVPLMIGDEGMSRLKPGWDKARFAVVARKGTDEALGIVVEYDDGTFIMITKYDNDPSAEEIARVNELSSQFLIAEAAKPFRARLKGWQEIPAGAVILEAYTSKQTKTGLWAKDVAIIDSDKCTTCFECKITCAENAIQLNPATGKVDFIDYDFCKGCGMCAVACPPRSDAISMVKKSQVKAAQANVFDGTYGKRIELQGDFAATEAGKLGTLTPEELTKEGYELVYKDLTGETSLSGKRIIQVLHTPEDLPEGQRPYLYTFFSDDGVTWTKIIRPVTDILIYGMTEYEHELASRMQQEGFRITAIPSQKGDEWNGMRPSFEKAGVIGKRVKTRESMIGDIADSLTARDTTAKKADATLENLLTNTDSVPDAVVTAHYDNLDTPEYTLAMNKAGVLLAPFMPHYSGDSYLDRILTEVEETMPDFGDSLEINKPLAKLSRQEQDIAAGHRACAGCPIYTTFNMAMQAVHRLKDDNPEHDFEIANSGATGCAEVVTTIYPDTAWKRYLHTVFGALGSNLEGLNAAYRHLKKQGKLSKKFKFFGWAGDGGTYDIGFQALSGFLERGLATDSVYFCYDNGAYMNTGIQRSSATPPGAGTSTSPIGEVVKGKPQFRKDLAQIAAKHKNVYVAVVSPSHKMDFIRKVQKAALHDGPSLLISYANCTTGHRTETDVTIEQSKLAVESGFWPLFEIVNGETRITYTPKAYSTRLVKSEEKDKFLTWIGDDRGKKAYPVYFNRDGSFKKTEDKRINEYKKMLRKERFLEWLRSEGRFALHFNKDGSFRTRESEMLFREFERELAADWRNLVRQDAETHKMNTLMELLLNSMEKEDREARKNLESRGFLFGGKGFYELSARDESTLLFNLSGKLKPAAEPLIAKVRKLILIDMDLYEDALAELEILKARLESLSRKKETEAIKSQREELEEKLKTIQGTLAENLYDIYKEERKLFHEDYIKNQQDKISLLDKIKSLQRTAGSHLGTLRSFTQAKYRTLQEMKDQEISDGLTVEANTPVYDLRIKTKTGDEITVKTNNQSVVISDKCEILGIGPETVRIWKEVINNSDTVIVVGTETPELSSALTGKNIIRITDTKAIKAYSQPEIWKKGAEIQSGDPAIVKQIKTAMMGEGRVSMLLGTDFLSSQKMVLSFLNSGKENITALKGLPGVIPELYFDENPKAIIIKEKELEKEGITLPANGVLIVESKIATQDKTRQVMDETEKIKNRAVLGPDLLAGRIFARAGEGGVTAAKMQVSLNKEIGLHGKAAPDYGPERRGAPVLTNFQISGKKIRTQAIFEALDYSIVTNPEDTGWSLSQWRDTVKKGGFLVINSPSSPDIIRKRYAIPDSVAVYTYDATTVRRATRVPETMTLMGVFLRVLVNRGISFPEDFLVEREKILLDKEFSDKAKKDKIVTSNMEAYWGAYRGAQFSDSRITEEAIRKQIETAGFEQSPPDKLLTGSEAVAEAWRQINPGVFAMYPITPSTEVGQVFSVFWADGRVTTEYIHTSSEHDSFITCAAAAAAPWLLADKDITKDDLLQTGLSKSEIDVVWDALIGKGYMSEEDGKGVLQDSFFNLENAGEMDLSGLPQNIQEKQEAIFKAVRYFPGIRVVSSTASQGMLLGKEGGLLTASLRLPVVINVGNRETNAPLSIHAGHTDMYQFRDDGWINFMPRNAQEAYDFTIISQMVAERARLPVFINQDGFIVTHTKDMLDTLSDKEVKEFVGEYLIDRKLLGTGVTMNPISIQDYYTEHARNFTEAQKEAVPIIEEVLAEFTELTGRDYRKTNNYETKDADVVIVCMGSTEGTAMDAVDALRSQGIKAGLLALKTYRPFPADEIRGALEGVKTVIVMDRATSHGAELTPLALEVQAAIKREVLNLEYGRGGRNTSLTLIKDIFFTGLVLGRNQLPGKEVREILKNPDRELRVLLDDLEMIAGDQFTARFLELAVEGRFIEAFGPKEHIDVREKDRLRDIKLRILEILVLHAAQTRLNNKEADLNDLIVILEIGNQSQRQKALDSLSKINTPEAQAAMNLYAASEPGIEKKTDAAQDETEPAELAEIDLGRLTQALTETGLNVNPAGFRDFRDVVDSLSVSEKILTNDPFYGKDLSEKARSERDRKVISVDLDLLAKIDETGIVLRDFAQKYLQYRRKIKSIRDNTGKPVYDIVLFSRHTETADILKKTGFSENDFDRIYTLEDIQAANEGIFKDTGIAPDLVNLIENDYSGEGVANTDKDIILIYRQEDQQVYGTREVLRDILHLVAATPEEGTAESLAQLLSIASDILANEGELSDELKELIEEAQLQLPQIIEDGGMMVPPIRYTNEYFQTLQRSQKAIERAA